MCPGDLKPHPQTWMSGLLLTCGIISLVPSVLLMLALGPNFILMFMQLGFHSLSYLSGPLTMTLFPWPWTQQGHFSPQSNHRHTHWGQVITEWKLHTCGSNKPIFHTASLSQGPASRRKGWLTNREPSEIQTVFLWNLIVIRQAELEFTLFFSE